MRIIVEGRLVFEFGPRWQVEKYDEHPIFLNGIRGLQRRTLCSEKDCHGEVYCQVCGKEAAAGTKAVDILGHHEDQLYFIEIKDFRGYRIENKRRLRDGDLAFEVALKVRDTLAGLAGTLDAGGAPRWHAWAAPVFKRRPKVVLWLEEEAGSDPFGVERQRASTLEDTLKKPLRWLNPHVSVKSLRLSPPVPDLTVRNMQDGVFNLRALMKKQRYVSRDDFCREWPATPQTAGAELARLCHENFVRPVSGKSDQYTTGSRWDQFL
jgi:hypothetical protein